MRIFRKYENDTDAFDSSQHARTVYAIRETEREQRIATLRRSLMPEFILHDIGPDYPSDLILSFAENDELR
jgi:hypothetical protein